MAVLRFGINNPWLGIVDSRVKPVAARHQRPVAIDNAVSRQRHARPAPTSVVLQAAADFVWFLIVQTHFVKLPNRNRVDEVPGSPVVVTPVNSSVATGNDMVR